MKTAFAIALLLYLGSVLADGKVYSDGVPATIDYQRAIVSHDGARQALLIESKFVAAQGARFGWVLPLPAVPAVSAPDAGEIDSLYRRLEAHTAPSKVSIVDAVLFVTFLVSAGMFLNGLYLRVVRRRPMGRAAEWSLGVLIVSALGLIAVPAGRGVEVLAETRVGPYETKVVRGSSPAEVVGWLRSHGFAFDERDLAAFDAYVRQGWVFVTAKLDGGATGRRGKLVPPLLLEFPARDATYPLALTATGGRDTEVLLYVFAAKRMDADGRLPLRFADQWPHKPPLATSLQWAGPVYLTKFRGRMTPEQMRSDLVLKAAADNAAFRAPQEFGF